MLYSFENFSLDTARRELRRASALVSTQPQVFDVLVYLMRHRGRVVSKDDLLASVWNGRIVSESTLSTRINSARSAIGDSGEEQRLIRTAHGKGIRFIGVVRQEEDTFDVVGGPASTEKPPPDPATLPDKPSIAIFPFQNLSCDPEQEYFADGIVQEIITALSKIRSFFVIARNSTVAYKTCPADVKQVGRELGVRYVVEGSVRKAGNRVRINTELVDAATGHHIWAEGYEREFADLFAVQDEIAERVAAVIEPQLYAAEHVRCQLKPSESLDPWECAIRALSHIGQVTHAGIAEAEALCRRAIAIAPGYGLAHSLLAWVLMRRPAWVGDNETILPEAIAEARTAFNLDERDPWAHLAHGMVRYRLRHHVEGERALRRALALTPTFALAHACLGLLLAVPGTHEQATGSAEHALTLSPNDSLVSFYALLAIAMADFAGGRYKECIASARNTIERYPDHQPGHYLLAAAAAMQGDMATAAAARIRLLRLRPDFSLAWTSKNNPLAGNMLKQLIEGLRKAEIPEE